ncbi:MAG: PSD1 domain-containing protein [Bryobacteraceae bacterium]|nr:PSD1 domain-containing protein [Bryobacteraceae bacterium]
MAYWMYLDIVPLPMVTRLLTFILCAIALRASEPGKLSFNHDVRPILSKNCFACHGPDASSRQGNLRLDTRAGATGAEGGHAGIVPGDSAKSRIVMRITHPSAPMPPAGAGDRLSAAEIEIIKRWIDEGANYDRHWAFEPPVRPDPPKVRQTDWPKNEIDYFVLARLEAEGLTPSPEADRYALARRLYLDLVGLPPTPEQARAFAEDGSPNAYERTVDTLLNSPRYGERWATVWLDLARYADSKGYEADRLRTMWPYRDWVIRALNENMPFDRFTTLQLAGDLLPVPTRDQLIATGFHRNTMTNDEGGTDDEEFRDAAVKDRVATTGQVWMGLTWGCAQCHSHKFDPISHKEFYELYAFFNQTEDADKVHDRPTLKLDKKTTTLIMRELPADKRRATRIHLRGNFLDPGDPVEAAVPDEFHPFPADAPQNRLGLAKWLVDKNNPLTARVTVNRFWARLFGAGLVETEEDFGNQGASPSHPELLDWLATEFMRLDWDMKGIQKKIVMSATYRQSSNASTAQVERDPYNRLVARGPRVRLDAEMVRDQMLAASGLLSEKMYGPPVMPLQPDGVWQVVYSSDRWETSKGEDRYRRALYTLWRRTSPYPSATTFDAPSAEVCTMRRIRTNTPLQALVTLNDPVALEAARHLAARALDGPDSDVPDRIRRAFQLALVRPPAEEEVARLAALYEEARRKLEADPEAARDLLNVDRIVYATDRATTLIPDSREQPVEWRYRVEEPPENWFHPRFKDSSWKKGQSMFGHIKPKKKREKKPGEEREEEEDDSGYAKPEASTLWVSEKIWLRRQFTVDGPGFEGFRVAARFRGSFEVWINGVPAITSGDAESGPVDLKISAAAERTIRPGKNLIAVASTRTIEGDGDQFIDVSLTALRPPDYERSRADDAERAAWVTVAHVLLNLDETLAKR